MVYSAELMNYSHVACEVLDDVTVTWLVSCMTIQVNLKGYIYSVACEVLLWV